MSSLGRVPRCAARCLIMSRKSVRNPRSIARICRHSSTHLDQPATESSASSVLSETDQMRNFRMVETTRESFMDAEQVLLWWTYQRTPESVDQSLDVLEQMVRQTVPKDSHSTLHRSVVNAIVMNWQAVYKEGLATLSPHEMLTRLESITKSSHSLSLSGKALSIMIDVAVQAREPALAEQLLKRMLDEKSFIPSSHTLNTVLYGYSYDNQPFKVQELLHSFQTQKLPLNINSYNILLACLANNHQPDLAVQYLEDLCRGVYKVTPTQWTFHAVLHALANTGQPERAEVIVARLYDPFDWGALGVRPDTTTLNLILSSWARSGSDQAGQRAWGWLQEQTAWAAAGMPNVTPDVVSYGTVIHALCTCGQVEQAEGIVQNMYQQYITHSADVSNSSALVPNVKLLTPILEGWSKSKAPDRLQRAEHFFTFLKDWAKYFLETPLDRTVYNVMMDVYGRCAKTDDDLKRAMKLLQEMKESLGFQPSFATYSILIQLLLRHNKVDVADELMNEVLSRHEQGDTVCQPDERSLNQLIRCFCRAEAPEIAAKLLLQMCDDLEEGRHKNLVRPDVSSFGSVVAAFSRSNGKSAAQDAESIFTRLDDMRKRGFLSFGPDAMLRRARLLCWCKHHGLDASSRAYDILMSMMKRREAHVADCNEVLNTFVRQWKPRRAEKLLLDMIAKGTVQPNLASFNIVLLGWSRVNAVDSLDRIEALLQQMDILSREKGWLVSPDAISYNNLLHCLASLARSSRVPDAEERADSLLRSMRASDKASYLSYLVVIRCWLKKGNIQRAQTVLSMLFDECMAGKFVAQRKHFQEIANAFRVAGKSEEADDALELWQAIKQTKRH